MLSLPPCTTLPASGGWQRDVVLGAIIAYAIGVFALIVWPSANIRTRVLRVFCGVLLASAIPLGLVRMLWEERSLRPLIGHSWALTYGDPLLIPTLFVVAVLAVQLLPRTGWHHSRAWLATSAVLGVAVAVAFHIKDMAAYNPWQVWSITKMLHDFCAYPVLTSAMIYLVIPALFGRGVGWLRWVVALLLVAVAVVLVHEAAHPLASHLYHGEADWHHWGRLARCMVPTR